MPRNVIKTIIKACIPYGLLWLYRRIKPAETINRFLGKQLNKKHIEFSGCRTKWFGTAYGGFDVCTEMLEAKREQEIIVYSAGVGCDISFDMELMGRYGNIKILAFDPTPISLDWIKKQNLPKNYQFYPVGIGSENGKVKMYLPESHGVSFTIYGGTANKQVVEVELETIANITEKNGHEYIDILKLDIEGSEFSVLKALDFRRLSFGQILVEFHDRFVTEGEKELKTAINILRENGYYCFACSGFNEWSFINKAMYEKTRNRVV